MKKHFLFIKYPSLRRITLRNTLYLGSFTQAVHLWLWQTVAVWKMRKISLPEEMQLFTAAAHIKYSFCESPFIIYILFTKCFLFGWLAKVKWCQKH